MTHNKAILWLTTSFVLGASLGYLFNARFCSVSIGDRVVHEIKLNQQLRKLWTDHAIWMNYAISSLQANQDQEQAITQRLTQNQKDIGSFFTSFYGSRVGSAFTQLLSEYTTILLSMIKGAQKNDAKTTNQDLLKQKGEAIAHFLSDLNPAWDHAAIKKMFNEHTVLIKQELTAFAGKDWNAALSTFDKSLGRALSIADALYLGILKQFPQRF